MSDDDRLRESDLDRVSIALAHSGVRPAQYSRIMAPLRSALESQRLTRSAPASCMRSQAKEE